MTLCKSRLSQYHISCVVDVGFFGGATSDPDIRDSSSGVLLASHGKVLTHSTTLIQYLHSHQTMYEKLMKKGFIDGPELTDGLHVNILLERSDQCPLVDTRKITCNKMLTSDIGFDYKSNESGDFTKNQLYINTQESPPEQPKMIEQHAGKIICVWKVHTFSDALKKLMPKSDGWKFHDNQINDNKKQNSNDGASHQTVNGNSIDSEQVNNLLPFFVIIHIEKWNNSTEKPVCVFNGTKLEKGQKVHIVGSPFGILSPDVFMNSVSQGVVSNVSGCNNALILTDARCISGCEGAALCIIEGETRDSIGGIIVAPLCWKQNEWIGLAVACSFLEILKSLHQRLYNTNQTLAGERYFPCNDFMSTPISSYERAVYVKYGSMWGTGILLDEEKGFVITCSHVIKFNKKGTARIGVARKGCMEWLVADVIYAVPQNQVFDIAVLKLTTKCSKILSLLCIATYVQEGDPVSLAGYALFESDQSLHPSITTGVISKILTLHRVPVAMQTTCAVHAGASGGPVFNNRGELVAMITCNAKDKGTGAQYPHINLGIPLYVIWPLLKEFLVSEDPSFLENLHMNDSRIKALWLMQSTRGFSKSNL